MDNNTGDPLNNQINQVPASQVVVDPSQGIQTVPVMNAADPVASPPPSTDPVVQDYAANPLMDEEHYMMRFVPADLTAGTDKNGYLEQKGPELPVSGIPTAAQPVAEVNPVAAPVATPAATPVPVVNETPVQVAGVIPNEIQSEMSVETVAAPDSLKEPSDGLTVEETITYKNQIDDLLTLAVERNASDLHIAVDYPPQLRIDGKLVPIGSMEMNAARVEKMINSILDDRLAKELDKHSDVDFSYPHKSGNRFRVNIFFNKGSLAGAFRLIPSKIKTIAELNLPALCYELIKQPQGLVLFTGPTGSGKSTSIAAMIQEINLNYNKHIITIEDPIEYVFPKAKALVNQREIGQDAEDWTRSLRELLRQDPNVVLVGEMRDYETIASTITVAETGHLVFATLHTNSASQTIDRIIDVFPEGQQNQIRSQLANVIVAVIAQRLVPVSHGGRKAVFEVMLATPGIKNAIREAKTYQIDNMIQTNLDLGMVTLEKSLLAMIKNGDITIDQAMAYTSKPDELMSLLNNGK